MSDNSNNDILSSLKCQTHYSLIDTNDYLNLKKENEDLNKITHT